MEFIGTVFYSIFIIQNYLIAAAEVSVIVYTSGFKHSRNACIIVNEKVYNPAIIFITTTIGSSDRKSSKNNTWVIVGVVMAVVVVIVTVILIVTCFRYRQILKNTREVDKFQNAVYEGNIQSDTPPQVRTTVGDYEQPTQYVQLDSSKRVLIEENYLSLNAEGYDQLQTDSNEIVLQYTSLNTNSNHDDRKNPEESTYEEINEGS